MLVFATEIPVNADRTINDLFRVVREWILGSPHSAFTTGNYPPVPRDNDEVVETIGGDGLTLSRSVSPEAEELGAARYVQAEADGMQWSTEVVGMRTGGRYLIGVRVSCESAAASPLLPAPKKPVLVRLLFERLGGGSDGDLEVSDRPLRLEHADIDLASRAMKGMLGNSLPIVYVSAGNKGEFLLDPVRAARDLAGLAHVLVEPDRAFSFRLRLETDAQNAYAGALGIYWPEGAGPRFLLFPSALSNPDAEVFEDLRTALANRRPSRACTWSYVQSAVSHARLAALKQSGSAAFDDFAKAFDAEVAEMKSALTSAEEDILRLKAQIRRHETQLHRNTTGDLIAGGREADLFHGERLCTLLNALTDARARLADDSRSAHIVDDILSSNTHPATAERMRETVRDLLREYRSMDARTQRELESLGFEVTKDGGHFKLIFRGDPRYTFVAPSSGSDYRGGLNLASQVCRRLFSRDA